MKDYISSFFIFNRSIFDWKYYTDANVFRLFFHLVGKANHTQKFWRGIDIKRGELITSLEHLSNELALTVNQIRLALKKLDEHGTIKYRPTNKYTKIIIPNYDAYQTNNILEIIELRNKSEANNNQNTITNNVNKVKKEEESIPAKISFLERRAKILNKHSNSVMCNTTAVEEFCQEYRFTKNEFKSVLSIFNREMLSYEGQRLSINKYYKVLKGFLKNRYKYFKDMDNHIHRYDF